MMFASDNTGPAHPKVMEAMMAANTYAMPYGNDPLSAEVRDGLRALFEAPDASVHLVSLGTAANALALALMAKPWDAVFCHRIAHVQQDEAGAPEFYTNGAKLTLIDGAHGKMTPEGLRAAMADAGGSVHSVQRGPVTITNVTEVGTVYSITEIKALCDVAHEFGSQVHLDGARFANACAALGCTPAEMTWKAGIDAVSFGGTKNGCLAVEAIIFFDPSKSWELEMRRKRAGHLWSKYKFLSAQMQAYIKDDLWLEMAQAANARGAELAAGLRDVPGARFHHEPAANMIFVDLPRAAHKRAKAAGAQYSLFGDAEGADDELVGCRLVCDWSFSSDAVQRALALWRG